jgi:hypothetical protein
MAEHCETLLSKENACRIFATWQSNAITLLDSKPLPKNFYGTKTLHGTKVVLHEVLKLSDIIMNDIPCPVKEAYDKVEDFYMAYQKFQQITAEIKVIFKSLLSLSLYEVFVTESSCYAGYAAILLEVKFDKASQVKLLKKQLESIAQTGNQTVKDYADSVNHIVLNLSKLGYPSKLHDDFEEDLAERFLNGMTLPNNQRFRSLFTAKEFASFALMRKRINEETSFDELSKAQRKGISESVPDVALMATEDWEAKFSKWFRKLSILLNIHNLLFLQLIQRRCSLGG